MKNLLRGLVAVCMFLTFVSCDKSETKEFVVPSGSILLTMPGQTGTTTFNTHNITSIRVSSYPEGWTIDAIDMYKGEITVTAPSSFDDEEATEGSIALVGYTPTGATQSVTIYVAILQNADIDFTSTPSNCFVVTKPETRYLFDPFKRGTSGARLETQSVELLWQTSSNLIKYLTFKDGIASFYLEKDTDDDGNEIDAVIPGNAVIAARNAAGDIIWSWHIWVTTSDPAADAITIAGTDVMNRNLGAELNSNGDTDGEKILESYGLYYQWGRKDPFVGPAEYNFKGNSDARVFNALARRLYFEYEDNDALTGTMDYAVAHPMSFIKGYKDNAYDWLHAQHDDTLWSAGGSKTDNDPCPDGWRMPDAGLFTALTISAADDQLDWTEAKAMYGWHLEEIATGKTYFFSAAGRRNYLNGVLDNVNANEERPLPWTGYYWTCGTVGDNSQAMFFDLNTVTRTYNGYEPQRALQRANATPVRCVKM
ncbi:MAG: hypothetical protein K2F95_04485 [Alistipes sp.]|nr:hypothetical protein [Alistipes sp.]